MQEEERQSCSGCTSGACRCGALGGHCRKRGFMLAGYRCESSWKHVAGHINCVILRGAANPGQRKRGIVSGGQNSVAKLLTYASHACRRVGETAYLSVHAQWVSCTVGTQTEAGGREMLKSKHPVKLSMEPHLTAPHHAAVLLFSESAVVERAVRKPKHARNSCSTVSGPSQTCQCRNHGIPTLGG